MSDKKMKRDDLGNRMKTFYEEIPKTKLMRRTPVVIWIDGKAFHTFTRGFKRPFDDVLIMTMQETAKYLCENIQGCSLAYTQSDEICLSYHLNTISGCVKLPPVEVICRFFSWNIKDSGIKHGS